MALFGSMPGENERSPKAFPIGAEVGEVGWMGHSAAAGHVEMVEEAVAEAREEAVEVAVGGG